MHQPKNIGEQSIFWPLFVDLMAAMLMLLFFVMSYQFFVSGKRLQELSIRYQQTELIDAFDTVFTKEIESGQITTTLTDDEQRISLGEDILFEVGADTLNYSGERILKKCLQILESMNRDGIIFKQIQVEGHTDSLPVIIGSSLSDKGIRDNWDLGAARANNVVRYMIQNSRLRSSLFSSASYSWHQWQQNPQAMQADMRNNRKVEILLQYATPNK